jgi:hypothetical protein
MGMDISDILTRAVKTAIQSGLAIVVAAGTNFVDVSVWKAAGVAAGAALISALHNALITATAPTEE